MFHPTLILERTVGMFMHLIDRINTSNDTNYGDTILPSKYNIIFRANLPQENCRSFKLPRLLYRRKKTQKGILMFNSES